MWDTVTYADLKQAKQQLQISRDEITKRHAEELKGLDSERAELEALERLVTDFARRFKSAPAAVREPDAEPAAAPEPDASPAAPEPESSGEPEPAAEPVAAAPERAAKPAPPPPETAKPSGQRPPGRNGDERKYPQSNFDTFRRALSSRI
jgi:hypothetical protein